MYSLQLKILKNINSCIKTPRHLTQLKIKQRKNVGNHGVKILKGHIQTEMTYKINFMVPVTH